MKTSGFMESGSYYTYAFIVTYCDGSEPKAKTIVSKLRWYQDDDSHGGYGSGYEGEKSDISKNLKRKCNSKRQEYINIKKYNSAESC